MIQLDDKTKIERRRLIMFGEKNIRKNICYLLMMLGCIIYMNCLVVSYADAATVKAPKISASKRTTSKISLKINKVKNAKGYVIYSSTKKNSGYKKIATTKKNTYTHKKLLANKSYYYKAKSYKIVDGEKVYSKFSSIIRVKTRSKVAVVDNTLVMDNTLTMKYANEILSLVNVERTKENKKSLKLSEELSLVATERAKELVSTFSHTRPNGEVCFTILDEYKISYIMCGENIASGFGTPQGAMEA